LSYLSDVEKKTEKQSDFIEGKYELQTAAFKESSELRKAQLELEIVQGKASNEDAYNQKIALLKDEVTHTLSGSKERIEAEKAVILAEQEYVTKTAELNKKALNSKRELAEQDIAQSEESIKHKYALGQISQTDEIKQLNILAAEKKGIARTRIIR
jgi:hypothetical protein